MQIPAAFDYARAQSVEHAIALLDQYGPDSRVIAGGHSLLPMMKLRLARPEWLIDINDLTELAFIERDDDTVRIGAMVRHAALLESEIVADLLPSIRDAERVIADPPVRNRGTIGGSLCQADPAEDLSTVCAVLRAEAVIQGPAGERIVPMADFYRGPYETAVGAGELLMELRFPITAHTSSGYEKVGRRVGDWAVVASGRGGHPRGGRVDRRRLDRAHRRRAAGHARAGRGCDSRPLPARGDVRRRRPHRRRGLQSGRRPARPGRLQAPPGPRADRAGTAPGLRARRRAGLTGRCRSRSP